MSNQEFYAQIPKGTKVCRPKENTSRFSDDRYEIVTSSTTVKAKVEKGRMSLYGEEAKIARQFLGLPAMPGRYLETTSLVSWGDYDNKRFALAESVTEADAPKPATRKSAEERGPTMQQRLQKDTKWKLTAPVMVDKMTKVRKDVFNNGNKILVTVFEPDYELPAGTEFQVLDKPTRWEAYYGVEGRNGYYVRVNANGKDVDIKVTDLVNPEQISEAAIVPVFVIRDSVTGHFFKEVSWDWSHTNHSRTNERVVMAEKLTGAKKWNRLSDVRSSLLERTGYYYDLPGAGNLPEWMGHAAEIKVEDVPRTWEIVKIDKLTKKVVETIEIFDTLDRQWRLRDLTVKYGSGVRACYSELEKKGKLEEFEGMLVFAVKDPDGRDRWYDEGLTDQEKASIASMLEVFDKKEIRQGKGTNEYAIAVKDVSSALMIKLQYEGDTLECHLINLKTLTEVVKED